MEEIKEDVLFWCTWEELQKIFDTTEVAVGCTFYERKHMRGEKKCWTIIWDHK